MVRCTRQGIAVSRNAEKRHGYLLSTASRRTVVENNWKPFILQTGRSAAKPIAAAHSDRTREFQYPLKTPQ